MEDIPTVLVLVLLPSLAGLLAAAVTADNENLRILARPRFVNERPLPGSAGADIVVSEKEVAEALTRTVFRDLEECARWTCPEHEDDKADRLTR